MNPLSPEILFEAVVLRTDNSDDILNGWVDYRGARLQINLSFVPEAKPGDIVLVQGRVALTRVEDQA